MQKIKSFVFSTMSSPVYSYGRDKKKALTKEEEAILAAENAERKKQINDAIQASAHRIPAKDQKTILAVESWAAALNYKTDTPLEFDAVYNEKIEYSWGRTNKSELTTTSLGATRKYKVVFVSPISGIAYLKELNALGRAYGPLRVPFDFLEHAFKNDSYSYYDYVQRHQLSQNTGHHGTNIKCAWVIDSSYVDSLILGDQVDVVGEAKEKRNILQEIKQHNKSARVYLETHDKVNAYVGSLRVGDTFWTDSDTSYTVSIFTNQGFVALNARGEEVLFLKRWFLRRNIYNVQPRSYSKELRTDIRN